MKKTMYNTVQNEQPKTALNSIKAVNESKVDIIQRGTVTEITMGGRTFQVSDPKRIEQTVTVLKSHDEALHQLRQRIKEHTTVINQMQQTINTLSTEVQRLKEITNGYGSQQISNY